MTPNVVQIVSEALSPEVMAGAADRLDEQPAAVAAALTAIVPGVFRLIGARAAEEGGPEALLAAIRQGGVAFSLNDPLGRLQTEGAADPGVLGQEGPALAERAADFAGVGPASASALVTMAIPLALGALARSAPPPLNAETLGRTLREQTNNIERAFPPAFTLGGPDAAVRDAAAPAAAGAAPVLDRGPALAGPSPAPPIQPPAAQPSDQAEPAEGLPKWLLPLLAVLILLAVVFVLMRSGDDRAPAPAPEGGAQASAPAGSAP